MAGPGYPMVGSHDPSVVARAHELAAQNSRAADSWEIQMLYGIRPDEQRRLAAAGTRVRAYVPYGVGPTSSGVSPPRAPGCGPTSPTASTGTPTSCAGWPSAQRTCASSCAPSSPAPEPQGPQACLWPLSPE